MAYLGFLVKIGDGSNAFILPHNVIAAETYTVTLNSQDLDSNRDTNGELVRNSLERKIAKVEFNLRAMLNNEQFETIWSKIRRNYINDIERRVRATVYIPELNDYITDDFYIPDISFELYSSNSVQIKYKQIRIALIGYGVKQ